MECSGFWRDPLVSIAQESVAKRVDATASHLDALTLKRMRRQNRIDTEDGGAGPMTSSATFCGHQSSHDRFREINRSLIGCREPTAFSQQPVAVGQAPIDELISIGRDCHHPKQVARTIHIPGHTVMKPSGFVTAAIPTRTQVTMMSDVTAGTSPRRPSPR
jgi:hypothetical protein